MFILALWWVWLPDLVIAAAHRADPRVLFSVRTSRPIVALTIDDGPSTATDSILDVLREYDARATFFLIGDNVVEREETVRRIVAARNEIAHHMMTDEPTVELAAERFDAQFDEMHRILSGLGGVRWFRPGSGWYNRAIVDAVERRGYRLVLGSVYPFDAQIGFEPWIAGYVLDSVESGDIIVLHDGPERGLRTARVLRVVLAELAQRGFEVVTVTQLIAGQEAPATVPYSGLSQAGR